MLERIAECLGTRNRVDVLLANGVGVERLSADARGCQDVTPILDADGPVTIGVATLNASDVVVKEGREERPIRVQRLESDRERARHTARHRPLIEHAAGGARGSIADRR